MKIETRIVSSLAKVFCKNDLDAPECKKLQLLQGETGAFQVAFKVNGAVNVTCRLHSELAPFASVREVGLVPCTLPAVAEDAYTITTEPGLFPDPLLPLPDATFKCVRCKWNAFWVTVKAPKNMAAGTYRMGITLHCEFPSSPFSSPAPEDVELETTVEILPVVLKTQDFKHTLWFYADCLSTYYHVEPWSERHWEIVGAYMADCVAHGVTMIYTPLWSVPLDTMIGGERPTVQLLEITRRNGIYEFDFTRLRRWIDLALEKGYKYFEFSHLFTQWGAKCTPKIVADTENGPAEKIFGWDVSAQSQEYKDFLAALLPALSKLLKEIGIAEQSYFHVSDEPSKSDMEAYGYAMRLVRSLLPDFKIIDALSATDFVTRNIVDIPIPTTDELAKFTSLELREKWVYYCGNWINCVPNRQFGMPSERNRVFGVILYVYGLDGLLNWGYNFWYTQFSRNQDIDPYVNTDAGRAHCGGGSFMVYPAADGTPVDSLRHEIMLEAMQDLGAMQMLEARIGRQAVLDIINDGLDTPVTINVYPHSAAWLLGVRARINKALCE